MKFNSIIGKQDGYYQFSVEGGQQAHSIGDQVWIAEAGDLIEVYEDADEEVVQEAIVYLTKRTDEHSKGRYSTCYLF